MNTLNPYEPPKVEPYGKVVEPPKARGWLVWFSFSGIVFQALAKAYLEYVYLAYYAPSDSPLVVFAMLTLMLGACCIVVGLVAIIASLICMWSPKTRTAGIILLIGNICAFLFGV